MNDIEKPEDLFKILEIENLDKDILKSEIYNMLAEASALSNGIKYKEEMDNHKIDTIFSKTKKNEDLNEILYDYIFVKWILSTVKSKVENTSESKERKKTMYKIFTRFNNPKKLAEFLENSKQTSKGDIILPNIQKKSKSKPHEWDLSRYAYKGKNLNYDVKFRIRINPKTKLILNSKKDKIYAFLVGDFTVGRDEQHRNKTRVYKMLSVINKEDVYMIVGKFDEDDIKEDPEFYTKYMFNRWNLKNADENNFGFPGRVMMDEYKNKIIVFDTPGCRDLIKALSIARKQFPEIFCSFNKKTRNRKNIPGTPGTPGEEGGR